MAKFGVGRGNFHAGGSAHRTWDFFAVVAAVVLLTTMVLSMADSSGRILSAGLIGFFSLLGFALVFFMIWKAKR